MAATQVQQSINPMANLNPATAFGTQSNSLKQQQNVQQHLIGINDNQKSGKETKTKPTTENTGRWTKDEHDIFLQGLEKYGKEWKKIALMIETRTVVQIRTHAQKYFQKIAKSRELQGKEVPGDLTSTASNPRPIKQREKLSRSHQKRSSYASNKKLRGNSITKSSQGTRSATKQASTELAAAGFDTYNKDAIDRLNTPSTSFKGPKGKRSFIDGMDKVTPLVSEQGTTKKLKISTNKIDQAYLDAQDDIKWFLANASGSNRLPDSSPTSVSELGMFRSLENSNSLFDTTPPQDEYNGSDSDDISPLCITENGNELFGDGLEEFGVVSNSSMDLHCPVYPFPEMNIDPSSWEDADENFALNRPRTSSLGSIECL